MWVNVDSFTSNDALLCVADTDSNDEELLLYNLSTDSNKFSVFFASGSSGNTSTYAIPTGQWVHLALTKSGTALKLYANGSEVFSGSYTNTTTYSRNIFIGVRKESSYEKYFNGSISNLALYQTGLDAQTISQMAKSRFTPMRDNRFSVVDFDGSNDKITFTRQTFTGAFSIIFWFNGDVNTDYQKIFDDSQAVNDIFVNDTNGAIVIRINNSIKAQISSIPNNEWCHLAFTRDGSGNIKSYLNGFASGTASSTDSFSLDTIGDGCVMSMASVSMYNVEKSAEEVYAIYQQGITYDESSLSGLVGYWRMGDDTSKAYPTIADSSSNSNDGTITNGASDDIVQQMVAGYDLGAFESSSEELGGEIVTNGTFDSDISNWTDFDSARGDASWSNGRLRIDNTTGTGNYYIKQ
jgi:hypothetical protein